MVKGKLEVENNTPNNVQQQQFDSDRFTKLFAMCYENVQLSRKNCERASRMLKGITSSFKQSFNNIKINIANQPLEADDLREVENFAKQFGSLITTTVQTMSTATSSIQTVSPTPNAKVTIKKSCAAPVRKFPANSTLTKPKERATSKKRKLAFDSSDDTDSDEDINLSFHEAIDEKPARKQKKSLPKIATTKVKSPI